ncbi:MAG: hypothetical protein IJW82_02625 [Clostridia bacterium]|nr:hypothetical protein [Clostridia bacterium]
MGLRDEILQEKESAKKVETKKETLEIIQPSYKIFNDKKLAKQKFKETKIAIKKGNIPNEWGKIYDEGIKIIRENY